MFEAQVTDQEKNELVARKLGWSKRLSYIPEEPIPRYCASITAAWKIIRYCEDELPLYQIDLSHNRSGSSWFCTLGTKYQNNQSVEAPTAPLAIVDAFLKMEGK